MALIKCLELSTAHVSQETMSRYLALNYGLNDNRNAGHLATYPEGAFCYVPDDDSYADIPSDLLLVIEYARKLDATLIRFDRDADVVGLPIYGRK